MSNLSRESEQIARDWLCESQGDPVTAPLRYAIRLLLEEAEAEIERLRTEVARLKRLLSDALAHAEREKDGWFD